MALLGGCFRPARHVVSSRAQLAKLLHRARGEYRSKRSQSVWTDIKPELSVNPKVSLVDEGLRIEASGLVPGHPVTIRAEMGSTCGRTRLVSFGCYVSDDSGFISTSSQPSLGGTYRGTEPLGPIWSMQSTTAGATTQPGRLTDDDGGHHNHDHDHRDDADADPAAPVAVSLSLLNGHVGWGETRSDVLAESCEVWRYCMAGNIERTSFREGPMEAALFVPTDRGSQPLPAIVDFRGAEDHHHGQHLAALLASHGYVTMTTKFPRVSCDPDSDRHIDIECLKELVHRLSSHDMVDGNRIGVFSRGDGVAVGLGLAAHFGGQQLPIRCLVGVNGVSFNTSFGWVLPDGTRTGYFPYYDKVRSGLKPVNGITRPCSQFDPYRVESCLDSTSDAFVPVGNISIPLLMFTARDNPYLPSNFCMQELKRRLREVDRHDQMELVEYAGAGHLLDPTNVTHTAVSRGSIPDVTDGKLIMWGGETAAHMRSQTDMWRRALDFFRLHLRN